MSILAAGLFVAAQGCSSSSSSGGDLSSACMQGCAKELPCLADAGYPETMAMCMQTCLASGAPDGGTCTNESAIVSAAQACAAKNTCADLEMCALGIPKCEHGGTGGTSGTGTGGTNGAAGNGGGTGGTSGAGGAGATASCSVCDKANTCCQALATLAGMSTASCTYSTATCTAMATSAQSGYAGICQDILTGGAAASASCR